jgi:hypothetical protein
MVDSMIHLQLCDKKLMKELDCDLTGVRTLTVEKNRFGSSGWLFLLDLQSDGFVEKFRYGIKNTNISDKMAGKDTTKNDVVNVTLARQNDDKFSALNKMKSDLLKKKQELDNQVNETTVDVKEFNIENVTESIENSDLYSKP